jgi:CDP-diacylglycerol pyrophosphatase
LSRIVGLLSLISAFALAAQTAVTESGRPGLWKVVQACVINHGLTGAAFPCLEVDGSDGEERGYVILREADWPARPRSVADQRDCRN